MYLSPGFAKTFEVGKAKAFRMTFCYWLQQFDLFCDIRLFVHESARVFNFNKRQVIHGEVISCQTRMKTTINQNWNPIKRISVLEIGIEFRGWIKEIWKM